MKVEGWARAAIAVAATTKGSIADKIWDKSLFFSVKPIDWSFPNERNEAFLSLLCDPTLPINGCEVEHARKLSPPLSNLSL